MKWIFIIMAILFSTRGITAFTIKPSANEYSYVLIDEYFTNKTEKHPFSLKLNNSLPLELNCNYMKNDYRNKNNDVHGCAVYKNRHYAIIESWNKNL